MNFDAALGFTMTLKQVGITIAEMGFTTNSKMEITCFLTPIRYYFECLGFFFPPFSLKIVSLELVLDFKNGGAGLNVIVPLLC